MRVPIFFHRSPILLLFLCLALVGSLVIPATAAPEASSFAGVPEQLEIRGAQGVLDVALRQAIGGRVKATVQYPRPGGSTALATAWADFEGRITVPFDAIGLEEHDTILLILWSQAGDLLFEIPTRRLPGDGPCIPEKTMVNEDVPVCTACPGCVRGTSVVLSTQSREGQDHGVPVVDGSYQLDRSILGFETRLLGFDLTYHYDPNSAAERRPNQTSSRRLQRG